LEPAPPPKMDVSSGRLSCAQRTTTAQRQPKADLRTPVPSCPGKYSHPKGCDAHGREGSRPLALRSYAGQVSVQGYRVGSCLRPVTSLGASRLGRRSNDGWRELDPGPVWERPVSRMLSGIPRSTLPNVLVERRTEQLRDEGLSRRSGHALPVRSWYEAVCDEVSFDRSADLRTI
jgi:hypothetical protein